jgi:hypothetical protein
MRKSMTFLCLLCAIALWAGKALGSPSYCYTFDAAAYSARPGITVPVSVYLQETFGPGDTSVLASPGYGMYGTGVAVSWAGTATVQSPAAIVANAAFSPLFTATDVTSSSATLSEGWPTDATVYGSQYEPDVYRLLVGTFEFAVGTTPGAVTTLTTSVFMPGLNVVNDVPGTVLDSAITNATATITVVTPEPGSLVLLAMAGLSMLGYTRYKLKWAP